jgi:hypothetical protein
MPRPRVTCSICLEDEDEYQVMETLPCNHEFHGHCIRRWMSNSYSCPYCRDIIPITTAVAIVGRQNAIFRAAIMTPLPVS